MTQIFIDNQEVNLNVDQTFDYNTENPLFTKSSEYSGEVVLSLLDPTNARIFKSVNRMEVKKEKGSWPVRLMIDNNTIVIGIAKVIEVNDKEITLQILGGNAEVNNKCWEDEIFIDEMNLGRAYQGLKYHLNNAVMSGEFDVFDCEGLTLWAMENNDATVASKFFNTIENEDCVVLPAESANQEDYPTYPYTQNEMTINVYGNGDNKSQFVNIPGKIRSNNTWRNFPTTYIYAVRPQPYLVVVIEKVIQALGYEIKYSDLRNDWTKNIYIPNVRKTLFYNEMLPHWSVNRFLTEVENFLGVIFYFDAKKKSCDIIKKDSSMFGTVHLEKVDDNYNVKIDEESNEEYISKDNVAYADLDDNKGQVPEEIENAAAKKEFSSFAALRAWFADNDVRIEEKQSTIAIYNNLQFVYWNEFITEINQYRKLKRNDSDKTITLGIVPAKLTMASLDLRNEIRGSDLSFTLRLEPIETVTNLEFRVPFVNMGSNIVDNFGTINIQDAIENGGLKSSKEKFDVLQVAIANFDVNSTFIKLNAQDNGVTIKYRNGYTHGGSNSDVIKSPNLRLYPMDGTTTLYDHSFNEKDVSVNLAHEITFFDDDRPDPRASFIIRGKKYLCQNIKYSVDIEGFAQKKIGTFYPKD